MIKRTTPVSLYPVSFVLLIGLFTSCATICLAEEEALYQARVNVCSLIDSGKYAEAASATDTLVSNFSGDTGLPESLYWIGERYERYDRFDKATSLYQQITQNYPNSDWVNKATLAIARTNIKSLIVAGKYGSAKTAIGGFIADYNSNPDLPEALFWITERFQRADRLEDANQYYQKIIDDFPQSPYAEKTRLRLATVNTLSLLKSQDYDGARAALDKLITDFAGNPDLPDVIFWTAERFMRVDRFDDANQYYQKIIDNFSSDSLADNAKLWLARATIESQIVSQNYDGAKSSLANFISDFNSNPDLPEALYWISERYERLGRFDDSNAIYQQLSQNLDNPWSNKAKVGISRANIISLIVSGKYDEAKEALDKFTTEFSGNSRLPASLYWIAERYQRQNRFEEANRIYKQIVENYSGNPYADKAQLDIRGTDILISLAAGDANGAGTLLDKFVADFKQHYYANDCLNKVAERCYYTAEQNQPGQANFYYAEAESIWQRIIDNLPGNLDKAYYHAAVCRKQQGNLGGAIDYFQKVIDNYANSEYAGKAQTGIGLCYEALKNSNNVTAEEFDNSMENSYKNILTKYPDSPQNADILLKLGWLTFKQGRIEEAVSYFENALAILPDCCKPNDALYVVGRYYQKTGQNEKAIKVYEALLKSLPESDPQIGKVKQNLSQIAETTNQ